MKLEKILSVVVMSVVLSVFAGLFALLFNVVNPKGISLLPKFVSSKEIEFVKPTAVVTPERQKPAVKSVVVVKKLPIVPIAVKKPAIVEVKPVTREIFEEEKTEVTLEQAKKCFDSGIVTFVDARAEFVYIEKHIKGAISLSASRFNFQYGEIKNKPDKNAYYIVYCSSKSCHLSEMVAGYLKDIGFRNIRILPGGWDEWENAGYPIEGVKAEKNE